MPKPNTFPTLFDELKTISISFLNKHGYLRPDQWRRGTITWSRGEGQYKRITGSISIAVNSSSGTPYLELDYKCDGKPINYKVQLVSIPSNIAEGAGRNQKRNFCISFQKTPFCFSRSAVRNQFDGWHVYLVFIKEICTFPKIKLDN